MINWRELHGDAFAGEGVLVTGGAGFIGSHLVQALVSLGARVAVLDDLSGGSKANLESCGAVRFVEGSILDRELLDDVMARCSYVFHEAALGSVPRSVELPELFHEVNATGTLRVLEAARRADVKRVIFAASSSAYGNCEELPKRETFFPSPQSPYAASKVACEALMGAYAASYGLDTACLRYFNVFGPRQNANSAYAAVIAAFARAILSGRRPVIYGDGQQSRDFTFVSNVVHANLLAARAEKPLLGAVVNVGCGQRITVNDLAEDMAELLCRPDLSAVYQEARAGDVKHSLADLAGAQAILGYRPVTAYRDGLKVTLEWYRQMHAAGDLHETEDGSSGLGRTDRRCPESLRMVT